MKYADPQTVVCPGCGAKSLHPVATLLAVQAECPLCRQSLREIGEQMNDQLREVRRFGVALEISLAIEKIDNRIEFHDEDLEGSFVSLADVVAMVERVIARQPSGDSLGIAEEFVYAAVKKIAPSIECPSKDLPLDDVARRYNPESRKNK